MSVQQPRQLSAIAELKLQYRHSRTSVGENYRYAARAIAAFMQHDCPTPV